MKIIIAGSRNFDNYEFLKNKCNNILINTKDIEIVSGGAIGADIRGEKYADENGYKLSIFPAEWAKYGKKAGYIRNEDMAKYADALIAFWDGKSPGTKHMIDLAYKHKLLVRIIYY